MYAAFAAVFTSLLAAYAPTADGADLGELSPRSWSTADGLPHNLIHDIAKGPNRYLWFATWEGVARFDGSRFLVFNGSTTPELGERGVRALAVDEAGALWFGTTQDGVARFDGEQWTRLSVEDGLASNKVVDLLFDGNGRLWVATEDSGISVYKDGRFRHIKREQLRNSGIFQIQEINDGSVWVATQAGISVADEQQVRHLGPAEGVRPGPVYAIFQTAQGQLYLGTDSGLLVRQGQRFVADPRWADAGGYPVSKIASDGNAGLLVGTLTHGLFHLTQAGSNRLSTQQGLPNNRITALRTDAENHIWVGTMGGLSQLVHTPFVSQTSRDGLSDNYARAVLQDRDGAIWVGTSNGLNRLTESGWVSFTTDDGLASNSVLALAERGSELWVGTYGAGINVIRDGRISTFERGLLPSGHVRAMVHAVDGRSWIGTNSGLVLRDGAQTTTFTAADGLPRNFIYALHEASDGALWIGTGNGLAVYRQGEITSFSDSAGYDNSNVFAFAEDEFGDLWIATETGLLHHRVDGGAIFTRVGADNGMPENAFFSAVIGLQQQLWLSSNHGVLSVELSQLRQLLDGSRDTLETQLFQEEDGLATRQANGGSQPAAIRTADGRLIFATARGAAITNTAGPRKLLTPAPPAVNIEQISIDHSLRRGDIEMQPTERTLQISFSGAQFSRPEAMRFVYRLDGFDDWSEKTSQRRIQYTNLPPGEYQFQLRAWLPGDVWSDRQATVDIKVLPHFYQTLWFRILLPLLVLLSVALVVKWRHRALRSRARELSELVGQQTRDLQDQTRRLMEASAEKTELLQHIESQSKVFEHQARHDPLTGLPNRRHFDEVFERTLKNCQQTGSAMSIALLDIDHFKRVNDRFSHQAGDAALTELGGMLRQTFEPHGVVVARYGGEEFVALLPGMPASRAAELCEQLRTTMEQHEFGRRGDGFKLTISAGISGDTSLATPGQWLRAADARLYQAKHGGRNQVCF